MMRNLRAMKGKHLGIVVAGFASLLLVTGGASAALISSKGTIVPKKPAAGSVVTTSSTVRSAAADTSAEPSPLTVVPSTETTATPTTSDPQSSGTEATTASVPSAQSTPARSTATTVLTAATKPAATKSAPTTSTTQPVIAGYSVNLSDYGAKCEGTTNDIKALQGAVANVSAHAGGGTVVVPAGTCRIVTAPGSTLIWLAGQISIQGVSSKSTLSLDSDDPSAFRELFKVGGGSIALRQLNLVRGGNVYGVMIDIARSDHFTVDNVVMDGRSGTYSQTFHGIFMASGSADAINDVKILNSTIKSMNYGLLMTNSAKSVVNGFSVDRSAFTANTADDLEFNAPSATMTNVSVTNSKFSNNLAKGTSAGIAVGLANVQNALIQNNNFDGYFMDPVHVEDRSAFVTIDSNSFIRSFTASMDYASHVFIIGSSHDVKVTNNTFDASQNSNNVSCVFAEAGGASTSPNNITISGNTFILKAGDRAVLSSGSTNVNVVGNRTIQK